MAMDSTRDNGGISATDAPLVVIPEGTVKVSALPRPIGGQRLDAEYAEGITITEIFARLGIPTSADAHVAIDGVPVPRAAWGRVRPRRGRRVTIRVWPSGGGDGDSNKIYRTLLLVVVAIAAAVLIYFTYGAATPVVISLITASVAVSVGGTIAVNALFPPPKPQMAKLTGGGAGTESPTLSIPGARNQASLYGTIPTIFGRYRIYPPEAL